MDRGRCPNLLLFSMVSLLDSRLTEVVSVLDRLINGDVALKKVEVETPNQCIDPDDNSFVCQPCQAVIAPRTS